MKKIKMTAVFALLILLTVAVSVQNDSEAADQHIFTLDDAKQGVGYSYSETVTFTADKIEGKSGQKYELSVLEFKSSTFHKITASFTSITREDSEHFYTDVTVTFEGTPSSGGTYTFILNYESRITASDATHKTYAHAEFSIAVYSTQTLCYDDNGGSGGPGKKVSTTKTGSSTFTISSDEPTRSGYTFLGWSTSSTAVKPKYVAKDSITVCDGGTTTLYAVWEKNVISILSEISDILMIAGDRCDAEVECDVSGVTLTLTGADWMTSDSNKIGGIPTRAGTYNVTITVSKSNYESATTTFTVTVVEKLVFQTEPDSGYELTE